METDGHFRFGYGFFTQRPKHSVISHASPNVRAKNAAMAVATTSHLLSWAKAGGLFHR